MSKSNEVPAAEDQITEPTMVEVVFSKPCRHAGTDYKEGQKGKVAEVAKVKLKKLEKIK